MSEMNAAATGTCARPGVARSEAGSGRRLQGRPAPLGMAALVCVAACMLLLPLHADTVPLAHAGHDWGAHPGTGEAWSQIAASFHDDGATAQQKAEAREKMSPSNYPSLSASGKSEIDEYRYRIVSDRESPSLSWCVSSGARITGDQRVEVSVHDNSGFDSLGVAWADRGNSANNGTLDLGPALRDPGRSSVTATIAPGVYAFEVAAVDGSYAHNRGSAHVVLNVTADSQLTISLIVSYGHGDSQYSCPRAQSWASWLWQPAYAEAQTIDVVMQTPGYLPAAPPDVTPPVFAYTDWVKFVHVGDESFELPATSCSDETDGEIVPDYAGSVDTATPGRYFVTYACADEAGNSADPLIQYVVVMDAESGDREPPTVTINGRTEPHVDLGSVTYADPGATCVDETDGVLVPHRLSDPINYSEWGHGYVDYVCADNSGNVGVAYAFVTVSDMTEPVIDTSYGLFFTVTTEEYRDNDNAAIYPAATCTDNNHDRPLTDGMRVSYYSGKAGVHDILYECDDGYGNVAEVTRFVSVVDSDRPNKTPPVITLGGPGVVEISVGEEYAEPGWGCSDDTEIYPSMHVHSYVPSHVPGAHTLLYTCHDQWFNLAVAARTVIVSEPATGETAAPAISIGASADHGSRDVVTLTASATDDSGISSIAWFDGPVQIGSGGSITHRFLPGVHHVTAVAVDNSTNLNQATSNELVLSIGAGPPAPVRDTGPPAPVRDTGPPAPVRDTGPPAITIGSSALVAVSSTPVTLSANASDASGIASVTWHDGDEQIGMGETVTITFAPGAHTITATAVDGSPYANAATSEPVVIRILPPTDVDAPRVSISATAESGTPSTLITLAANATDASGISEITWHDGNAQIGTGETVMMTFAPGTHTITATAVDGSANANAAESAPVVIKIAAPDTVAPRITIDSVAVAEGAPSSRITLGANASDASGIASVTWHDGDTQIGTGETVTMTFAPGTHTITATAVDGSANANSATSAPLTVTVAAGR